MRDKAVAMRAIHANPSPDSKQLVNTTRRRCFLAQRTQREVADILSKEIPPVQFELLANALTGYTVASMPMRTD